MTGRSHRTIPPECRPRWRGKSRTARASRPTSGGRGPPRSSGSPRSTAFAQHVHLLGAVSQGLAHVADGRAGAIGDDVGDLCRAVPAVALVDVGDDLLAPARLDVDVDVGRPVALGGEEPLEQQSQGHGIGAGDTQREADGGVGGRAPALAVDVVAATELHDVPDDEEVPAVAEGADHLELVVDLGPRPRHALRRARAVAIVGPAAHQLHQPAVLGVPGGHLAVGEAGGNQVEVEGARRADLGGLGHRAGPPGETALLLGPGAEVGGGGGGEPAVELGQWPPGPHRGQGGGQWPPGRGGVMDVVGGRHGQVPGDGEMGEGVVAGGVERVAVVPELHGHVVGAEGLDEPVELAGGRRGPGGGEGGSHRTLAAPGQDHPVPVVAVPAVVAGQVLEGAGGSPFLPAGELGLGDGPAQAGIAHGVAGQDHQVGAGRVGGAGARPRPSLLHQGELGPEDRGQPERPGRLGEADHPVQAVVVGEGEGVEAEPGRLRDELLGVRRAVEEAEVGMAVELRIRGGHSGRPGSVIGRFQPPPPPLPRRAGGRRWR